MARTTLEKNCVDDSPLGTQSIETTNSMVKLAEEALEMGKLLGVEVITHKANAVKRITESLKSNRGTRSMRSRQ